MFIDVITHLNVMNIPPLFAEEAVNWMCLTAYILKCYPIKKERSVYIIHHTVIVSWHYNTS